jgi:transcriptional regulator with XRE-family HTH domain
MSLTVGHQEHERLLLSITRYRYRLCDMTNDNQQEDLNKFKSLIADEVRSLRHTRQWTQADLARQLRLSQSRLSEIERGDGSFTAEQFLLILRLFNVAASHFAGGKRHRDSEIQNALARLGALHLQESSDILPSEELKDAAVAVRETLVQGAPRLLTALGPVLVRNVDRLNLNRLYLELLEAGLERRLAWLVENTVEAIGRELASQEPAEAPPRAWAQLCRRADVVLGTFLKSVSAAQGTRPLRTEVPDVLDPTIRSKKTLDEISASSSSISRKWGVVTGLLPEDFAKALRAARADH